MTEQETRAILSICVMAAFADGAKDEREREQVRRVAATLTGDGATDLTAVSRDVLLTKSAVEETAATLGSRELRQLAYEMAVGVCDADEARSTAEIQFLDRLRGALGLEPSAIEPFHAQADALAAESVVVSAATAAPGTTGSAELDRMILNTSILNGALELLPQTLATMAIIPLQMKMVYRIGTAHGFELDRGHIKEFLATVGVGLSSQAVERVGAGRSAACSAGWAAASPAGSAPPPPDRPSPSPPPTRSDTSRRATTPAAAPWMRSGSRSRSRRCSARRRHSRSATYPTFENGRALSTRAPCSTWCAARCREGFSCPHLCAAVRIVPVPVPVPVPERRLVLRTLSLRRRERAGTADPSHVLPAREREGERERVAAVPHGLLNSP
jgi:tellurite resistance protein